MRLPAATKLFPRDIQGEWKTCAAWVVMVAHLFVCGTNVTHMRQITRRGRSQDLLDDVVCLYMRDYYPQTFHNMGLQLQNGGIVSAQAIYSREVRRKLPAPSVSHRPRQQPGVEGAVRQRHYRDNKAAEKAAKNKLKADKARARRAVANAASQA